MIKKEKLSEIYSNYYQASIEIITGNNNEENRKLQQELEIKFNDAFNYALENKEKEELQDFIKLYVWNIGKLTSFYTDAILDKYKTKNFKDLPKKIQAKVIQVIDTWNREELEEEIIKLIGLNAYNEKLQNYLRTYSKENRQDKQEQQTNRNYYNYDLFNKKGSAFMPLNITKNKLVELADIVFSNEPLTFKEKQQEITIKTQEGIFILNESDKKMYEIVNKIWLDALKENPNTKSKEITLLNIANEYYPNKNGYYKQTQLTPIAEMLYKGMMPLIFKYSNGGFKISPFLNIEMEKKDINATTTIKINGEPYYNTYNKLVSGETITIYLPKNVKGITSSVKNTTLTYYLTKLLKDKVEFIDINNIYNLEEIKANNKTEKARTRENIKKILEEIKFINGVARYEEKKNAQRTGEVIGYKVIYRK